MTTRMQQRRGTAAEWQSANTLLAEGEIGYETDTNKFKIGDGSTAWNSLGYFVNAAAILDGAPETLDTLNELAAAINDNPNFFQEVTLSSLIDVDTYDAIDGQALVYDQIGDVWLPGTIDSLPSQSGQSGKYLTTDGSTASWAEVSGGGTADDNAIFKATLFFGGRS